jgi:pimeloyl-ACP methyl ester carboxylesterase
MLARCLCALVASLLLIVPVSAQELQGDWQGAIKLPDARQLRLVFQIQTAAEARYTGVMASPDQGASDIPLGAVTSDGKALVFDVPSINGAYRGTWNEAWGQWEGEWTQGKLKLPLDLTRPGGPGAPPPGSAARFAGEWDGVLDAGPMRLRLVMHVRVTKTGTFASFDSVDQAATGIPISAIRQDGTTVRIAAQAIGAAFEGTLETSGQSIIGRWMQGGASLPLTFVRRAPGAGGPVLQRPQTPKPPFPYRDVEVSYDNASAKVRLAGTLTLPQGSGPFPAVLLIAGSGPLDRDESLLGHKPFLVLADYLTRRGIAVLRVDKRGVGKSTGNFNAATTADFASDVEAGLAFLRSRADINASRIGLIGHSEGGAIAPLVAARDPRLAFVVLLAAPGLPGNEIVVGQAVDSVRLLKKWGDERIRQYSALLRKAAAAIAGASNGAEAAARAREIFESASDTHGLTDDEVNILIAGWSSNWFRYFMAHDPVPALRQTKIPVLALNGSLDVQVRAPQNLAAIRQALAHNSDVEVHDLPRLNHLFQTAKSGQVGEYAMIEETLAPSVLEMITTWIDARLR